MKNILTVKEVAKRLGKSEETVKRWIRAGKFANAYKVTDKQGWQIPCQDVQSLEDSMLQTSQLDEQLTMIQSTLPPQSDDLSELVSLAYQAVTMTSPTETIINYLHYIGIKRTLEILLIMQQSPNKVKNPEGFIKKAIGKGWTPTTLPIKKERNIARIRKNILTNSEQPPFPFYNWLDQE